MQVKTWLVFALITTLSWGLWGAITGLQADSYLPSTVVYMLWSLTFIPPCLIALKYANWQLARDKKSVLLGSTIGLLGAGGQFVLFYALTIGPAYLIFPLISLSPLITIALSVGLLRERTGWLGGLGILLAMISLPLFEYNPQGQGDTQGTLWFVLALVVMAAWGLQAYVMKLSNVSMNAESIFFYMSVTALLLNPLAWWMTDFSHPIELTTSVVSITLLVQLLNPIGALCLVYAFRFGKAIVVSPLTNAGAPLISALITIVVLGVVPGVAKIVAIVLALIAAGILAIEPEEKTGAQVDKG